MDFNRRTVQVNGIALNVIIEGEGPDVLLVHGFPDDHTVWRNQIPALVAAGYRVIAPDTRGTGDSEMPPRTADYKIEKLVADLVGILDALGIDKVRLVAHDWGAAQAWHLALWHPKRVERYIAMSVGHPQAYANGGLVQKLKGYYVFLIQLRGFEVVARSFDFWPMKFMVQYPAEFPHMKARVSRPGRLTAGFNYYRANFRLFYGPPKYPRVQVPVVGVYSDGDIFLAEGQVRNSEKYCDAGWKFIRVEGANHWLQLDAPERVTALLLEHLA